MGKNLYNLKSSRVFRYALIPKTRIIKKKKTVFEKLNFKTFAFQGNIVTGINEQTGQAG